MPVRPFHHSDAPALAHLFYAAIHEIAALHYSPEQARAWAPYEPSAELVDGWAGDGRIMLVATDALDEPLAFGDLEADGHIDHLFCRPDQAGTGVSILLYEAIEATARGQGLARLFVEASEPARRFFLRRGFRVDHRRDFEVRGVPIHNYRMEKMLD